jgi:hypothetical protein
MFEILCDVLHLHKVGHFGQIHVRFVMFVNKWIIEPNAVFLSM